MAAAESWPSEKSRCRNGGDIRNRLNWNCWVICSAFYIFLVPFQTCKCAPQVATSLSSEEAHDFSVRGLDILTGAQVEEPVPAEDVTTRQFFQKFGVKKIPTTTEDPISHTPTFMLDLYLELSQTGVVNRSGSLRANTVRSFYETDTDRGRRNIYEFDISGVLPRERVVAADLRLYKMPPRPDRLSNVDNSSLPSVIQVIQWPDAINSTPDEKQLLDQRFVDMTYSGLVTFNVTSAFRSFQAKEGDQIQKAFRVKVRDYFEEKFHTKKVVKFAKDPKHEDRRPLLVLFINDSAIPVQDIEIPTYHPDAHHRGKRHAKLSRNELVSRVRRGIGAGRTRTETEPRNKRQSKVKKRGRRTKGTCKLYDFTVDFEKLEWQNWIIAPTGSFKACDRNAPSVALSTVFMIGTQKARCRGLGKFNKGTIYVAHNQKVKILIRDRGTILKVLVELADGDGKYLATFWRFSENPGVRSMARQIAPGYAANYCDGYCPFPLDDPFNATNHATVQVILHEKGIKSKGAPLPSPCCVPHEFENLHVLYLDENNVVLKEFDNMVATSCGCH